MPPFAWCSWEVRSTPGESDRGEQAGGEARHRLVPRNVITKVPFPESGLHAGRLSGIPAAHGFMSMNLDRHIEAHRKLFLAPRPAMATRQKASRILRRISRGHGSDRRVLPANGRDGVRAHALPKGEMTHRGAPIDPGADRRVALLTVEGENDDISGVGQTEAAHELCVDIPAERKAHWLQPARRPLRRVQRLAVPGPRSCRASRISCFQQYQGPQRPQVARRRAEAARRRQRPAACGRWRRCAEWQASSGRAGCTSLDPGCKGVAGTNLQDRRCRGHFCVIRHRLYWRTLSIN